MLLNFNEINFNIKRKILPKFFKEKCKKYLFSIYYLGLNLPLIIYSNFLSIRVE